MVAPVAGEVTVTIDGTTGRGHVSGVKRCASPWSCSTCSFRIRQRRAREVTELVEAAEARGHSALLVTLTVPHTAGESLNHLLTVLNTAQRSLWAGSWAQAFRARWGIAGQVRAVETTWGVRNGWGPHVHAVVILERGKLDNAEYVELWGSLWERWKRAVVGAGGREPNAHGIDVQVVNDPKAVADYLTDAGGWSIGMEVASGPVKLGRSSGRWSPFALLAAAAMWGDRDAADLWSEYESATLGKRAIVASRGLYEAYGVGVVDDAEAVVEEAAEPIAQVAVDPLMWLCLAALDLCRVYVATVEAWAVDGGHGPPPDPAELIRTRDRGGASP